MQTKSPGSAGAALLTAIALHLTLALSLAAVPAVAQAHAEGACPHGTGHQALEAVGGAQPLPALTGQDAFAAVAEIVDLLAADSATDWARVNVDALREHLVDMSRVMLDAAVERRDRDDGFEAVLRGEGRTLEALRRMLPAHGGMMDGQRGWRVETEELPGGVRLRVTAAEPAEAARLRGLGVFGFLASGDHHRPHHAAIARGGSPHQHAAHSKEAPSLTHP